MTREEAIRHLDTYSSTLGSGQTTQDQHEEAKRMAIDALKNSEQTAESSQNVSNDDLISRKAAIEGANRIPDLTGYAFGSFIDMLTNLPSAQPENSERKAESAQNVQNDDLISKKAAIEVIDAVFPVDPMKSEYAQGIACGAALAKTYVEQLPSAQPEQHTCVNCGRTANNGGWYADGGTRCPIEEHYALPKDGYCHLWEKRNVTDDNYPERREE